MDLGLIVNDRVLTREGKKGIVTNIGYSRDPYIITVRVGLEYYTVDKNGKRYSFKESKHDIVGKLNRSKLILKW